MAEPKERLKNFKVLSIAESGTFYSKKHGKELKQYATVLQGVDDPTKILNGLSNDPLPEGFAAESVVEDVWVYVDEYQGKVTTKFFFPQKTSEGGGGRSSGGGYKASPEELEVRKIDAETKRLDVLLKAITMPLSFAKDIALASTAGPVDAQTVIAIADPLTAWTLSQLQEVKSR